MSLVLSCCLFYSYSTSRDVRPHDTIHCSDWIAAPSSRLTLDLIGASFLFPISPSKEVVTKKKKKNSGQNYKSNLIKELVKLKDFFVRFIVRKK